MAGFAMAQRLMLNRYVIGRIDSSREAVPKNQKGKGKKLLLMVSIR